MIAVLVQLEKLLFAGAFTLFTKDMILIFCGFILITDYILAFMHYMLQVILVDYKNQKHTKSTYDS